GNFTITLDRPLVEGETLTLSQYEVDENGVTIEGSASDPVEITVGADGSVTVIGGTDDVSGTDDGDKLPKTATDTMNWMLGGLMALLAGSAGLFTRRKKDQTSDK